MYFNTSEIKPVAFYPYTSIVQDRLFEIDDFNQIPEIKRLRSRLIELFVEHDIKAVYDNKIAFEVEIKGKRIFYGFKDFRFSIGFSVRSDSWVKPITSSKKEKNHAL